MKGSQDDELKLRLKKMIIETCRIDIPPESVPDGAALIGSESVLELDSLDIIELSVSLKSHFGIQINDSKEAFRIMKSINVLADFIQPGRVS